jgi:hypothetical protein
MIQLHLGLLPNESLVSHYSVVNPPIISCFWVLTDTFARTDQCEGEDLQWLVSSQGISSWGQPVRCLQGCRRHHQEETCSFVSTSATRVGCSLFSTIEPSKLFPCYDYGKTINLSICRLKEILICTVSYHGKDVQVGVLDGLIALWYKGVG